MTSATCGSRRPIPAPASAPSGRAPIVTSRPTASALPGLRAAADDFVAAALGNVEPGVPLTVALGGARARGVRCLAVVLAGLGDAVALLVLELRHRRGPGLRRGVDG